MQNIFKIYFFTRYSLPAKAGGKKHKDIQMQNIFLHQIIMGNAAARQRLKFKDFAYIAKNTNFASRGVRKPFWRKMKNLTIDVQIVEDYYNDLIAKCPIGKMDLEVSFFSDTKSASRPPNIFSPVIFLFSSNSK